MKLWMDNEGGHYTERPEDIEVRKFDVEDADEIRRIMGRYDCGAFKAMQIDREEIAVWDAQEFFGNFTNEELGLSAESDLWEVEARLEAEYPTESLGTSAPDVPLEILNLREYLKGRQEGIISQEKEEEE